VLIIGAGGLGCPAAIGLASGGVDRLVLLDPDRIELSNLGRQVLYTTEDVGAWKVEVAAQRLKERFPSVKVESAVGRLDASNADQWISGADAVVDGTDDPATKFLINDRALALGKPAVLGGIARFHGLVLAVAGMHGPCYRCLFESPPSKEEALTCGEAGVLGPLAGMVGHLQARRTLSILDGDIAAQTGFVTTIDALNGRVRDIPLPEATGCPSCGGVAARIDITPYMCPMTFVRTRLALESLSPGDLLDVVMRPGEPARNIPRNLVEEGHVIVSKGPIDDQHYRVVVRHHSIS
jgi:molybdopterin/thiamine biosynthesis adenylyltransferase/TusA-related sulfurtransferase